MDIKASIKKSTSCAVLITMILVVTGCGGGSGNGSKGGSQSSGAVSVPSPGITPSSTPVITSSSSLSVSSSSSSSANTRPMANAGYDQIVIIGTQITLDGSQSLDADGDLITYNWSFQAKPETSNVALTGASYVKPTFTPDVKGEYVIQLIVNDGKLDSDVSTVTIVAAVLNAAPVANAGIDQNVSTSSLVTLDGSESQDANGDTLTYQWAFVLTPEGSSAALINSQDAKSTFTPDLEGAYRVQLIVNDGELDSEPSTVTITAARANSEPVANAGGDKVVFGLENITVAGSGTDSDGDLLTYAWVLKSRPSASSLSLSGSQTTAETFDLLPDVYGDYVLGLTVSDGRATSQENSITLSFINPKFKQKYLSEKISFTSFGAATNINGVVSLNYVVTIRNGNNQTVYLKEVEYVDGDNNFISKSVIANGEIAANSSVQLSNISINNKRAPITARFLMSDPLDLDKEFVVDYVLYNSSGFLF